MTELKCPKCNQPMWKAGIIDWRRGTDIVSSQYWKCHNRECEEYLKSKPESKLRKPIL